MEKSASEHKDVHEAKDLNIPGTPRTSTSSRNSQASVESKIAIRQTSGLTQTPAEHIYASAQSAQQPLDATLPLNHGNIKDAIKNCYPELEESLSQTIPNFIEQQRLREDRFNQMFLNMTDRLDSLNTSLLNISSAQSYVTTPQTQVSSTQLQNSSAQSQNFSAQTQNSSAQSQNFSAQSIQHQNPSAQSQNSSAGPQNLSSQSSGSYLPYVASSNHSQRFKPKRIVAPKLNTYKWEKDPLMEDVSRFVEWNRFIGRYFVSCGTGVICAMNPYEVPKTIAGWEELDSRCLDSYLYQELSQQIQQCGEVRRHLGQGDSLSDLNTAYLAVCNFAPGLIQHQGIILEQTLDFDSHKNVLLNIRDQGLACAARHVYFSIYRKFVKNTESSKLNRLGYIFEQLNIESGENIKQFADRLDREIFILNQMSSDISINNDLKLALFKRRILDKFTNTDRYYTALQLMPINHSKDYTYDQLVESWQHLYDELDKISGTPVTAFHMTDHSGLGKKTPISAEPNVPSFTEREVGFFTRSDQSQQNSTQMNIGNHDHANVLNSKSKNKITKDSNGKLICFQFAKHKECNFGTKCKYSHEPPAEALAAYSEAELDRLMLTQNVEQSNKLVKNRVERKWSKKFKSAQGGGKSKPTRKHKPVTSSGPTFQSAVKSYNNKKMKFKGKDGSVYVLYPESNSHSQSESECSSADSSSSAIDVSDDDQ